MDKLLFGISGLPIGDGKTKYTYKNAIEYLDGIGLDAMELPFVHSVNVTDKNKDAINEAKKEKNFYLSAHGSYYINLNGEEDTIQKSIERIVKGAEGLKKVEGRSLIFHPGYYLKNTSEETFDKIKQSLGSLPYFGVDYRLETTGKPTQFGSLEENVALCKEIKSCKLCIDFSHLHARLNGALKSYTDFAEILEYVRVNLGEEALEDLHIHISGIEYGPKGEKKHLPFTESDFDYKACLTALKDFKVKGCVICESPLLEKDALLIKEIYNNL